MIVRWRAGLLSVIGVVALVLITGAFFAASGLYNIAADVPHAAFVHDFMGYVRDRSIAAHAADIRVPRLDNKDMIAKGASHYDAMCTGCHLAPGMEENEMRPGMNPKPPLLAEGDFGTPAETFWVVKHGIKMTGMPAWGVTHSDEEIWNIVAFLQLLPKLSPAEYRALVAKSGVHREHDGHDDQMDMNHMDMSH
jgi:mono/diheme cytochrome c family protein